jgi:hypothetical protein
MGIDRLLRRLADVSPQPPSDLPLRLADTWEQLRERIAAKIQDDLPDVPAAIHELTHGLGAGDQELVLASLPIGHTPPEPASLAAGPSLQPGQDCVVTPSELRPLSSLSWAPMISCRWCF